MGALHSGHLSLIEASKQRCDLHVVTLFVNPTQFAPTEDLTKYPRPLEADLAKCRETGANIVFVPDVSIMYPPGFNTWVTVDGPTARWEGASRPTHFRGVTTIVMKLFQLVQPDFAFFGAKDYQQQTIIRMMVRDLDVPVEIIVCPTVREPDGLALSSRNVYLSPEERQSGLLLSRSLKNAAQHLQSGERDIAAVQNEMAALLRSDPRVQLDYAVLADPDTLEPLTEVQPRMVALVAAKVGTTRLIDNTLIELTSGN